MLEQKVVTSRALIVIPVHNAVGLTIECLDSLLNSGHLLTDIFIVDNGSTDDTSEKLKQRYPELSIAKQENRGYGSAANSGIAQSIEKNYKYTWLLNNDTVVLNNAASTLAGFMEKEENLRVGACSPVIYRADDRTTIDFAGGWLDRSNWSVRHINDPSRGDDALRAKPHQTFLTGCALFMRNEAAREVGMFDERFFMYWEDCDFSVRLVNLGWQLRLVPEAKILHKMQGSSDGNGNRTATSTYYETRNCFLLWRQYTEGLINRVITFPRILHWIVRTFISRKIGSPNESQRAAVEGVVDGLAGRYGKKERSLTIRQIKVVAWLLWYGVLPLRLSSHLFHTRDVAHE